MLIFASLLENSAFKHLFSKVFGGLAHLVERKHGMFEVIGSIPISST
jgi:hypothetical protein